eukprot:gb/GEZN01012403.1/.p1 GENE.gb/GEZN01012403.1/~~gb/GEZN01012403.1/.p1  ORF type:complete len:262 (+),score=35.55 gb/GEZN01012403.1/:137-922(+)
MDVSSDEVASGLALTDKELVDLDGLINTLGDVKRYHNGLFPQPQADLLLRLLRDWPPQKILPVLDVVRVVTCHADGLRKLTGGEQPFWVARVSELARTQGPKHQIMVCKIACNWVARRPRLDTERGGEKAVLPDDAVAVCRELLESLAPMALPTAPPASQLAYVSFAANAIQWLARPKDKQPTALLLTLSRVLAGLASHLAATKTGKSRLQFYLAVTLSTLAFASPPVKQSLKGTMPSLSLPDNSGVVKEALEDYRWVLSG